jgi:lipopolysaccharide exporter
MSDEEQHDYKSISTHMAKGAIWMVMMRWSLKAIGLINTVIIARLLTPDDFGIVAMAFIVIGFLEVTLEANADLILIRKPTPSKDDYNSVWTMKILIGLGVTAVTIAVAPLFSSYFNDERVTLVIQIISLRAAIVGFENIGVVDFRRNLDFSKEFRYWVIRRISLFVMSITLVFILRNYFALAITLPLSGVITVAISFYMSSYRPSFCCKKFKEIWSFSAWILCTNYMNYLSNRTDEIIIGGVSSTSTMGHYHIASDLAMLPTREVILPMTRALVPTFSKISHDGSELAKAFCGTFNFITILSTSVALGLFVVAEDAVIVLLGEQWVASVPFFKWLALYGGLEGLVLTTDSFFIVINKQKLLAFLNIARVVILIPTLITAGYFADIETIAITRTGIMLLFVFVIYFTILRISSISLSSLIAAIWRPLIASGIMAVVVSEFHDHDLTSHYLSLARDVITGALVFPLALCALWLVSGRPDGAEKTTLKIGWEQFNRRVLKR